MLEDNFPYVIQKDVSNVTNIFYPLSSGFLKAGVQTYINSTQRFPDVSPGVTTTQGSVSTLYASILFSNTAYPKPFPTGIANTQVINSSQLYEKRYTVFSGLRLPRVVISILPDEQLPGNLASPILTENTVAINGNTELMLQVNIRESEAASGFVEFEVPVYAVNDAGSHLSNLNGLFKARFTQVGVESEVVDGVMVSGKAYIKVKVPLSTYANGSSQLDLTQVQLYAATPACDSQTLYKLPTNVTTPSTVTVTFGYCKSLTASYNAPSGSPVVSYPYTLPADYLSRTNRVLLGRDTTEQTKYDNNLKDVSGKVATFVIGFIPILGDSLDLLGQVYNTAVGKDVDPVLATLASAGLVLDIFTGGVGDLTSIFKGGYKLSLQLAQEGVGGVLAVVIREQAQNLISGAISARQFVDTLKDRLKTFADFATPGSSCGVLGVMCWGIYDELGLSFKNAQGLTDVNALKQLDDEVNSNTFAWLEKNASLSDIASCPLNFGLGSIVQGDLTTQATTRRTLVCPSKTTGRIEVNTGATYPKTGKAIYFKKPTNVEATVTLPFVDGAAMSVRKELFDAIKKTGDERCHILGKQFGGSGSMFNFFPCNGVLNNGDLKAFEIALKNHINTLGLPSFKLKVSFTYDTTSAFPNRPTKMLYEYFDNVSNPINLPGYNTFKEFLNP
jgi:hypothetical protein